MRLALGDPVGGRFVVRADRRRRRDVDSNRPRGDARGARRRGCVRRERNMLNRPGRSPGLVRDGGRAGFFDPRIAGGRGPPTRRRSGREAAPRASSRWRSATTCTGSRSAAITRSPTSMGGTSPSRPTAADLETAGGARTARDIVPPSPSWPDRSGRPSSRSARPGAIGPKMGARPGGPSTTKASTRVGFAGSGVGRAVGEDGRIARFVAKSIRPSPSTQGQGK